MFNSDWPTFVGLGINKEYVEPDPDGGEDQFDAAGNTKLKSATYEIKLVRVNPDAITVVEEARIREEVVQALGKDFDAVNIHIHEGMQGIKLLAVGTLNDCVVPTKWESEINCEELSEWVKAHTHEVLAESQVV